MSDGRDTLFLTLTLLLDETSVCPITLSGTHFQCVRPTLI